MASENRGPQAGSVAIAFLTASWLTVSLRVYVRAVMMRSFGIDDYTAVLSLVLFTLYCAFVLDGVHYGTGRHLLEMIEEPHGIQNFVLSMKAWWIAELAYVASTTVLKISIGFFLLRVCVRKVQRTIIWVVVGIVTIYSCYYFIVIIFQCLPVSYFWNRFNFSNLPEKGKCISDGMVAGSTYTHSALSIIADWTLGILPIFVVWELKMNPRTKVSVAIILGLGALGSTATIVRIPYIKQLTQTHDFLFANVDVSIWSTIEPGIGITASAMATLRPLFLNFFSRSRLLGSSTNPSQAWVRGTPGSRQQAYFRSGNSNDNRSGGEGFGLSGLGVDIPKGSGVSTTIHSLNDIRVTEEKETARAARERALGKDEEAEAVNEIVNRMLRFGSLRTNAASSKALKGKSSAWNSSQSRLADDSSSEETFVTGPQMGIRKTTEITTTKEWRDQPGDNIPMSSGKGDG
ncbi:hypothetical protein B0O99DRAFT_94649 [Bisporella sp. PMI_857]|nr:hypothetical protein B0O99DRAFT_94649 [Bisporella sp. PMI_857]